MGAATLGARNLTPVAVASSKVTLLMPPVCDQLELGLLDVPIRVTILPELVVTLAPADTVT